MIKRTFILGLFLAILSPAFGHGEDWIRLSFHPNYSNDVKNKTDNFGLDINFTALYLNAGTEYKYGKYDIQNNNDFSGFIGVGYFSALQLQFGYSTNDYGILRLKTEWRLCDLGIILNSKIDFLENITIKANLDKTLFTDKNNWFYSFGIGYSFNVF